METIKTSLEKEKLEERQRQDALDAKRNRVAKGHRVFTSKPEIVPDRNGNRKQRRAAKATQDLVVPFVTK